MRTTALITLIFLTNCGSNNNETIVSQLITHYKNIQLPASYAIAFDATYFTKYQSYDYNDVNGTTFSYVTEIDDDNKYAYNRRISNMGGGFAFDYITVIVGSEAFEYSFNKLWSGNIIDSINVEENYAFFKKDRVNRLNSARAKAFLDTPLDCLQYEFDSNKDEISIRKASQKDTVQFIFSLQPMRLKKIIEGNRTTIYKKFKPEGELSYATEFDELIDNELGSTHVITHFEALEKIDSEKLQLPEGYTFSKKENNDEAFSKIGDISYIIRDDRTRRNILFTKIDDQITVLGAPDSNELSERVLSIIDNEFPNAKISHVYVTHMHSDHIMGLEEYVIRGITIVADQFTMEGIKDYEPFQQSIATFKFKKIEDRAILNGIQYHYPKNGHCKSQGFAYVIADQIIYQGDFMQLSPKPNLIASTIIPEATSSFIERIYQEDLAVNTIVGQHQIGSEIPMAFINQYYQMHKGKNAK